MARFIFSCKDKEEDTHLGFWMITFIKKGGESTKDTSLPGFGWELLMHRSFVDCCSNGKKVKEYKIKGRLK